MVMMVVSDIADVCRGQLVVRIEGSSMASTSLNSSERLSSWGSSNQEATVVHKWMLKQIYAKTQVGI